jgi:hypothetical protein
VKEKWGEVGILFFILLPGPRSLYQLCESMMPTTRWSMVYIPQQSDPLIEELYFRANVNNGDVIDLNALSFFLSKCGSLCVEEVMVG